MARIAAPAYETGIAIPPRLECVCPSNCKNIDHHHNAFCTDDYEKPNVRDPEYKELLKRFRRSEFNIFWVYRCVHEGIIHKNPEVAAFRPAKSIVEDFLDEAEVLADINESAFKYARATKRLKSQAGDRYPMDADYLLEEQARASETHSRLLGYIEEMTVVPPEVITGALLLSAPQVAKERLRAYPDHAVVAPYIWPRERVVSLACLAWGAVAELGGEADELMSEAA